MLNAGYAILPLLENADLHMLIDERRAQMSAR
jgi:hypothetical protein